MCISLGHAQVSPPLAITELMYHPPDGDAFEFIELQNMSAAPLNLNGIRIGGVGFAFSQNEVLGPREVAILIPALDENSARKRYAGARIAGVYTGRLSDNGELITLRDHLGILFFHVEYDDGGLWPTAADGGGRSLEWMDAESDANDARQWRASLSSGGTPGIGLRTGLDPLRLDVSRVPDGTISLEWQPVVRRSFSVVYRDEWNGGAWRGFMAGAAFPGTDKLSARVAIDRTTRFYSLVTPALSEPCEGGVVWKWPDQGMSNVPSDTAVIVAFCGPMEQGSVDTRSFTATDDLGRLVIGQFDWTRDGRAVRFLPAEALEHHTDYRVVLTDKVRTRSGEPVPLAWSFRIGPAPKLKDDRAIYLQDENVFPEIRIRFFPNLPGSASLEDINRDIDPWDTNDVQTQVLFQAAGYGAGLSAPNARFSQRGQSTRKGEQKSYQVTLLDEGPLWRGHRVIHLNKHPYDLTRLRNQVSFELFQTIPNFVSLRSIFCRVLINETNYGLFSQIEHPDRLGLDQHHLDPGGHLYKANLFEFLRYPETLKLPTDPGYDARSFERILEVRGRKDHQKLLAMLDDVNDGGMPIARVIARHFELDNYLTWFAINILSGNLDTASQNFLLYSPRASSAWYFLPWDYDGTWGFYQQPDQARAFQLPRWRQGLANWWGVVLHRRFLQEAENRQALHARVLELLNGPLTPEKIAAVIRKHKDTVAGVALTPPDRVYMPVLGPEPRIEFDREVERLPSTVLDSFTNYMASLEWPMPIFLDEPAKTEQGWVFRWEKSYDFQGDGLRYDFAISRTPDFAAGSLLIEQKNLDATTFQIPNNIAAGTNYWRVIVRDTRDPAANWQIAFDTYSDPATFRAYHGVRQWAH